VWHADGTFGVYFHMAQNGVLVSVGEKVVRGQPIALVGNTGSSSAPHLHFEVVSSVSSDQSDGVRSTYSAAVGSPQTTDGCYLPRNADQFWSTNG
jgi:murein DD-endopeptidase MepM/ murein hydrolase activator NlpD